MVIGRKNSQDAGRRALYAEYGTSSWVTVVSVSICVCEDLIDGLTFIPCYTIVIGAQQSIHSRPFVSKLGNYVNDIKCWLYTI